ncbi:MAG: hypothetical protein HY318_01320 [Armatimonadetes bacterium]|nr:hypothetical protein [Armatimonadota bacterium]
MIHIPHGRDNIEKHEIPDYDLVHNAPWWKINGWRLVPSTIGAILFWLLWIWISSWVNSGGFETSPSFLFLVPTPSTASEQWRKTLWAFHCFAILFIGIASYVVAFISEKLMVTARKWQYRYQVNLSAWRVFGGCSNDLQPQLSPDEQMLCYTRTRHELTDGIAWFDAGLVATVGIAVMILLAELLVEVLLDGQSYALECVLPFLSLPICSVVLIHVTKGVTLDAFLSTWLCSFFVFTAYLFTLLTGAPVIPVWPVWLAFVLLLVEWHVLVVPPYIRLLVVTNKRLLVVTPPGTFRRTVGIREFSGKLAFHVDSHGRVAISQTDSAAPRRISLVLLKPELLDLTNAVSQSHPEWTVETFQRRFRILRSLPLATRQVLGIWFLVVVIGTHAGDCLLSCAATYRLLLPPIRDLTEGRPERLYDSCRFVLSLMPDIPVAESLGAYAAWNMDRLDEAAKMGSHALALTASKGKTGILARNVVPMAAWEQKAMGEWKRLQHRPTAWREDAARELFIAERLATWRADSRGSGFAWQHAKIHAERALKLDPRTAPEVKRLRAIIEKSFAEPQTDEAHRERASKR